MKYTVKKWKQIWAFVLSVMLLIMEIPIPTFAETKLSSYLDGWTVQAAWSTLSSEYEWNSAKDETCQPKLVVTYRVDHAEKDYPAGSLTFLIPGIGAANRTKIVKASQLAADEPDSEWDYDWNQEQDIYTFTNQFEVKKGQSVSGGFELLWSLNSRELEHGYHQSKSPVFAAEGAGAVTMKPVVFRFTSIRDRYRIDLSRDKLYDEDYGAVDEFYVWYEFTTRFDKDWLARGLYKSDYYVTVKLPEGQDYEQVVIQYAGERMKLTQDEQGYWGFYPFRNRSGNLGGEYYSYYEYFTVGFQKENLVGQQVTVHGHLDRLYQDEAQWTTEAGMNEIVDAELTFTVEDYRFIYSGYIYSHDKWNRMYENDLTHQAPFVYSDRLNAINLYNGKIVQFTLKGKADRTFSEGEPAAYSIRRRAATPSDAEAFMDKELSVGATEQIPNMEDWDDIRWREHERDLEDAELTGITYEKLHPERIASWSNVGRATDSDAEEDGCEEDGIVLIPDIFLKNPFLMTAYAAEATPSDAENEEEAVETAAVESASFVRSSNVSQIGEDQEYSMVLGDDRLAVFLNDGSIRNLEDHEYDIVYVTVPWDGEDHDYEIYGASAQNTPFEDYVLLGTGDTASQQTTQLPEGVKAVLVRVNGITGSHTNYAYVGIRLHLDWNEQQKLDVSKRPDHENRLVNFSYMRALYVDENGYERSDNVVDSDNYDGTYGEDLAQSDQEVYREYLQRAYSNVWLRSAVTNLTADVSAAEFTGEIRHGFASQVTASGTIIADNPGTMERFSVYTILPEGLIVDVDEAEIAISGSAQDMFGGKVTSFSDFANISVREMNGKMMIIADFDCLECPLEISQETKVSVTVPVTLSYMDYLEYGNQYTVKSYVMVHDDGIDRIGGKAIMADEYDVDEDGILSEKMAYAVSSQTVLDQANEWREYVAKSVKSAYSDGYQTDTVTRVYVESGTEEEQKKSEYSYRLQFGLGSDHARNIVFFDRLEQGALLQEDTGAESVERKIESQWQGQFISVDTTFAQQMGMVPTVYYSLNAAQEYDLSADGWTAEIPGDPTQVKSIAVVLNTDEMNDGMMKTQQMVYVTVHMRAPSDVSLCGKKAVNQYAVRYDAYGLTDSFEKTYLLTSSETTVRLLDTVGKIVLQKVDSDHRIGTDSDGNDRYAMLTGAKFQVYDSDGNALFAAPKELSSLGRIAIRNVPYGTYYWEEVEAPAGYERIPGLHGFEIDGVTEILEIQNERIPGRVILTKTDKDSDNHETLAGAAYELYQASGSQVFTDEDYAYTENGSNSTFVTGENGQLQVTGLPWGSYYFVEIAAPEGYELNSEIVDFSVGAAQFREETGDVCTEVTAYNRQKTASITLKKTDEASGVAIKDAVYSLYRAGNEDEEIASGLKTNAAGEIIVTDLKFGTYYFVETRNAGGYVMPEGENATTESVTLDASTANQMVEIGHTNERQTGSVIMTKKDDTGQLVGGAEYELYYKAAEEHRYTLYGSYITGNKKNEDSYGELSADDLQWGDYYFIESEAPKGYELSNEKIAFTVDKDTVQNTIYLETTDQRKKGSVKLIKTDKTNQNLHLEGAVFELYRMDGTRCVAGVDYMLPAGRSSIETGADGSITLTGITQGGYYFQEIKAPESYSISDERIRFSITKENADIVQELTALDEKGKAVITIHKAINEIYEAFGNPTFLFRICGTDGTTYMKSITLDERNLTGTIHFEVDQGSVYTVTELPASRYRLEEVIPGIHAAVSDAGTGAELDLVTNTEAAVTFINRMEQYEKFSHTSHTTNIIRDITKLTAIHAAYIGEYPITDSSDGYDKETESYTLSKEDLIVTAYYDDGTSALIRAEDYTLSPETVDGNSDSYTGMVTYTEDGITRMASFSVGIDLPLPLPKYTVIFELNGALIVPDGESSAQDTYCYVVKEGTKIESPENEPVRDGYKFCGWYMDAALQTEAVFPDTVTSDKKYYAKWEEICIKVKYAVSIYGIEEDLDENGNLVGLTFGPATGASYLVSGKGHTPVESGQLCMHDMSWDEIILQSRTDPSVFRECLENGCTHAVPLKIKGPLMKGGSTYPEFRGDGVGTVFLSIGPSYRQWNRIHSAYFTDTEKSEYKYGCNLGGWPDSAVRNTLNGTVTENMLNITNKDNGFAETKLNESTAMISAFPEELRTAIVAKQVKSDAVHNDTSGNNVITYDKLWLFSGTEMIKDDGSGYGNKGIRPNEGTRYSRQDVMGITTTSPLANTTYSEEGKIFGRWTRSLYSSRISAHIGYMIDKNGYLVVDTISNGYGLSPGFCLPGPKSGD